MADLRVIRSEGDVQEALATLDSLRESIVKGEVIAFHAVGIEPDDATRAWFATTRPVSSLRMLGALYVALACFEADL